MEFLLFDAGTPEKVGLRLEQGAIDSVNTMSVMSEIVLDMMEIERTVFESQGRRGGGSWARLKPDTVDRKGSSTILYGTERFGYSRGPGDYLFRSLSVPGAEFQIIEITNEGLIFGTEAPFAGVHQKGAPSRGIPARPFFKFLPTDYRRWNNVILRHLMKAFR